MASYTDYTQPQAVRAVEKRWWLVDKAVKNKWSCSSRWHHLAYSPPSPQRRGHTSRNVLLLLVCQWWDPAILLWSDIWRLDSHYVWSSIYPDPLITLDPMIVNDVSIMNANCHVRKKCVPLLSNKHPSQDQSESHAYVAQHSKMTLCRQWTCRKGSTNMKSRRR